MSGEAARDHLAELEQLTELSFVRSRSGRVHVEQWWDEPELAVERSFGEMVADWLIRGGPRARTICGLVILCEGKRPGSGRISEFDDNDTCTTCVRLLGPYSHRAFSTATRPGARVRVTSRHVGPGLPNVT